MQGVCFAGKHGNTSWCSSASLSEPTPNPCRIDLNATRGIMVNKVLIGV
jgi:hypothetical protein